MIEDMFLILEEVFFLCSLKTRLQTTLLIMTLFFFLLLNFLPITSFFIISDRSSIFRFCPWEALLFGFVFHIVQRCCHFQSTQWHITIFILKFCNNFFIYLINIQIELSISNVGGFVKASHNKLLEWFIWYVHFCNIAV